MSDQEQPAHPRGSLDFVETSILDTIIPLSSTLNIEESLNGSLDRLDVGDTSPLSCVPRRQILFFDETVTVYIVLQTPYFEDTQLRQYLARVIVSLEVQVVNAAPEKYEGPSSHEVMISEAVSENQDPLVIVQGSDEAKGAEGHILVLWKMPVTLTRPGRLRIQNPSIFFKAKAKLKPAELVQPQVREAEYLQSQVPLGLNLLESFGDDPGLGQIMPRLSALRVSRVIPATQSTKDLMRSIKNTSRKSIKIVPAFGVRVRYARPNSTPSNPSIIAALDVDITPVAGLGVTLEQIDFSVKNGLVENLNDTQGIRLPLVCLPRDDVTFLYRLLPDDSDSTTSNVKTVNIAVKASTKISGKFETHISMRWQTSVDFTLPLNPSFGHASPAIRRDHRPAQLSVNSTFDTIPTVASLAITRPDALPSAEPVTRHQRSSSIPDFGVTMTFIAPLSTIKPGQFFSWQVFIVNRSDRMRKLALVVIPKRRRSERINNNRPPSTGYGRKDPNIADAFLDENILHAMQRNAAIEPAEIVCYSTDVRVGPLAPSACYTVDLRFMALTSGILGLEAVRIIDLSTQEHVDIRDLPSIVVSKQ